MCDASPTHMRLLITHGSFVSAAREEAEGQRVRGDRKQVGAMTQVLSINQGVLSIDQVEELRTEMTGCLCANARSGSLCMCDCELKGQIQLAALWKRGKGS